MDFLVKLQSSARPFVNDFRDIQREFTRQWVSINNEFPSLSPQFSTASYEEEEEEEEDFVNDLSNLPAEIKQNICFFLSSRDLVRMAQVSSSWAVICGDEAHWKRVYDAEKYLWDCVQSGKNATSSSIWAKFAQASSDLLENGDSTPQPETQSWKATFLLNHLANTAPKKGTTPMSLNGDVESEHTEGEIGGRWGKEGHVLSNFTNVTRALKSSTPALMNRLASKISPVMGQLKVPFKKIHRIPMLGEGLESASKDLLYSMMWPQNSSMFNVTCLYPGQEGFGSGVGFCVDDVNLNIAALHRCPLDDPRINWKSYFQKADGVIYVVSCKSLPNVERRQLRLIVGGDEPLAHSKLPLLVLQVCDEPTAPKLRPAELAEQLGLEEFTDRMWCVQTVDMTTLKGLPEALRWLANRV